MVRAKRSDTRLGLFAKYEANGCPYVDVPRVQVLLYISVKMSLQGSVYYHVIQDYLVVYHISMDFYLETSLPAHKHSLKGQGR